MNRLLIHITLLLSLLSCEDVYRPEIIEVASLPVIECRITNNPAFNYIIVSKTTKFTGMQTPDPINDAKIEVLKEDGTFYQATHTYLGYYSFNQALETGKRYKLRIILDKELFESSWETMPALPTIEKFYVEPHVQVKYANNLYGIPSKYYTKGFQASVDLPVNERNKYYLFRWHSYLQFVIQKQNFRSYEWLSFTKSGSDNMAEPSLHSSSNLISKHRLMFNTLDYLSYLDTADHRDRIEAMDLGWIFEIDQYSQSDGAHQFFKSAADQLKAEGQLFDPMYSQIRGNISCTTDPEKHMLGVFDLCSLTRHQYYVSDIEAGNIYYHKIEPIFDIPYEGTSERIPPVFWQRKR